MRVGRKACSALQGTVRTSRRVDRHDHVVGVVSIVYFVEIAFDRKVGPRKEGRDVACRKGLLGTVSTDTHLQNKRAKSELATQSSERAGSAPIRGEAWPGRPTID